MKLWTDGKGEHSAGVAVRATIKGQIDEIHRQVLSRGVRAVNTIRNAELEVLKGQRTGRVYRKPFTKRATYTASAPGESPARRTGSLRLHWNGMVEPGKVSTTGVEILAVLESGERYSLILENGSRKMAARPYVDKIKEKAKPEIEKIYKEPYA